MLLMGVKDVQGWIISRWNLTYPTGWNGILKACKAVMDDFHHMEILVDNEKTEVKNKEDLLSMKEAGTLTIRGLSAIIKVPIMITFYHQLNAVDVHVAMAAEEFSVLDYEKFNKSLCPYLDSMEIAMYN